MAFGEHPLWGTAHIIRADAGAHDIRRDHHRLHRGIYVEPGIDLSPVDVIRAAAMRAGPGAVVAGTSAAVLHGAKFNDNGDEVELIRDLSGQGRTRNDVHIVRTDGLEPGMIEVVDGIAVTSPIRTAYDLGRRTPAWMALGRLDALVAATGLHVGQLWSYVRVHPRTKGIRQLRELVPLIDANAESPGESWLRWVMIQGRLPKPETQIEVRDARGELIARFDLGYRRYKVGIDYDGVDFHTSPADRAHDRRRDLAVRNRGWEPIRVDSATLSPRPDEVIRTITDALVIRGYRPSE
ncbi:hypothetical protein [Williamsia sp. M5A3_1d]